MENKHLTELEIRKNLALNLRYLRKSHSKVSQTTLARILNIPVKTIRIYEQEKSSPLAHVVWLISKYYECTMEELLTQTLVKKG